MFSGPGPPPRRGPAQLYDSADDMQSAGSQTQPNSPSQLSVSEFGGLTLRASSSADTSHVQDRDSAMGEGGGPGFRTDALDTEDREAWRPEGVLEREDSASYQRRPPALAERQDSASNLQALAEAEAELVAGSRSEATDLPLRRDSAADMHLQEASPDSRTRPSAPGGTPGRTPPARPALPPSGLHSPGAALPLPSLHGLGASPERPTPAPSSRVPAHVRADSASDIPGPQDRPATPSPQPLQIPGSAFTAAASPFPGDPVNEMIFPLSPSGGSDPPSRTSRDWVGQGASSNTLAAARRLVSGESVAPPQSPWSPRESAWGTPQPSFAAHGSRAGSFLPSESSFPGPVRSCDSDTQLASPPRPAASELDITYRQDSALDSLAAARQAILPELAQAAGGSRADSASGSPPQSRSSLQLPGDPLMQARWLVANWADPEASIVSAPPQKGDWGGPSWTPPSSSTPGPRFGSAPPLPQQDRAGLAPGQVPLRGASSADEQPDGQRSGEAEGLPQRQSLPWSAQSTPALEQARALLHTQLGQTPGQAWPAGEEPSTSSHAYPDSPIDTGPPQAGVQSAFDVLQGSRQAAVGPSALLQQDVT